MNSNGWPAPAKLNLFLHVTGRRDDGYHLLQTVFQFLDFQDELAFDVHRDPAIRRVGDCPGVAADSDLVVRAARALQSYTGSRLGVDIHISKHIPMQAGLGGGSSDAATTLRALNRLWGLELPLGELAAIGVKLGADVPVFLHGHAAFAEGVGEELTDLEPAEEWYLIIRPDCSVSTAEIFNDADLTRHTPPITIRDFLAGRGHNDCLPVVLRRYPQVAEAIDWLGNFSEARMTGTGSTVFAAFANRAAAETVLEQVPAHWFGQVCRGQNQSPLLQRLRQPD
jgi:4-diphosphocytidyl-2-C-methyl-D-erythritol kinase